LHLLPTLWFRNTWTWNCTHEGCSIKPTVRLGKEPGRLETFHPTLGNYQLAIAPGPDGKQPAVLFTDNETNTQRLFGGANANPFTKDAFHDYVIDGKVAAVNPQNLGTKAAAHCVLTLQPGQSQVVQLRLFPEGQAPAEPFGAGFEQTFAARIKEADEFYAVLGGASQTETERKVVRQGYAGLLWNKQFFHYVVDDWLDGDPAFAPPPEARKEGRNQQWRHLYSRDIISMPDKWEYPWFAAWDLAFHMIPFGRIDPQFAKEQLILFLREWYLHPNGQLPAYEFEFSDVNPPVHAWAAWRVYKISGRAGERDRDFLERVFQKLLLNFTWWRQNSVLRDVNAAAATAMLKEF
jgi:hypothetical protein